MKRVLLWLMMAGAARAQYCGTADVLYVHGHILTGAGLRVGKPEFVDALSVRQGLIAETGGAAVACGGRKVVDLAGAFVMPGFNDAHTHMAAAGLQQMTLDLDNVASLAAMQQKIQAYAATLPAGAWVTGGGWDHTKWSTGRLPTRHDLDAVTGGHPAFLERTDGHIAVVNTAALKAAGVTGATVAPQGGAIDLDAKGEPTGIVRDAAMPLVATKIPPPDFVERRRALGLAIADALAHGVTSVQDFSSYEDFLVLENTEKEGRLKLRFAEWMAFDTPLSVLETRRVKHDSDDPLLHLTSLKGFMDGSLGSRTAALNEPYTDDAANSGLPRYDQAKLNQMAAERAAMGFQLNFHAIGDRANDMALDAFAAAEQVARAADCEAPPPHPDAEVVVTRRNCDSGDGSRNAEARAAGFRFRIEHAQVVSAGAFERFHELGVIASMQPVHLMTDMAWAGARLGPERSKRAYAWRSMLDHHVTLAFGTDYPVESISPFRGLYEAVTRMNEAGTQTFEPQEKISIGEALYAYTQGSAFAEFREQVKGTLRRGMLADFVVLDRDLTTATPQEILHTRVLRTVVGGETVYTAPAAGAPADKAMRRAKDDE